MPLSRAEIEEFARKYFGDLGDDAIATATAIAFAESGGDPAVVGDNYPKWQTADSPYRYDYGLMQINSVHGYDPARLADPDFNMSVARKIYDLQGWNAWTTYKFGTYQQHYQSVTPQAATPSGVPPALSLDEWYKVMTDVFHPAYRSDVDSRLDAVGYRMVGTRRYRVYEVMISE
jgi:hypothetical protein